MARPPAIYWMNKANLCRALAHKQIEEGDTKEGVRNLFRMSYALNMARYEQELEKEKVNGISPKE